MSLEAVFNPVEEVQESTEDTVESIESNESEVVEQSEKVEETEAQEEQKVEEEPTSTEETEKESWTLEAVKDERRKRQEAQQELESLKKEFEALKATPQEPKELPSVFDSEEGFVNGLQERYEQQRLQDRFEDSAMLMAELKPDYHEKEKIFIEMAKENPMLANQLASARNPAKFAYEQAEKFTKYQEMQNIDSYRDKVKAELRAELEAEYKAKAEAEAEKSKGLKPSLTNMTDAKNDEPVVDTLASVFA